VKKKRLLIVALALLLILGLVTFFGENGILHLLRLKKEMGRIKEANLQLEKENEGLKEEVRKLKQEKKYIEEIARKELGMVKEGEIIYQFEPPNQDKEPKK
jgi:cell division protein FtsB